MGHRNRKGYTKSVATLKIVARRDVFKQHFMAIPAAIFYNNRLPLQEVSNMLGIISFTEFMFSYCLARHFIEMCQQPSLTGMVQAQVINYSLQIQFIINKKPK